MKPKPLTKAEAKVLERRFDEAETALSALITLMDSSPAWVDGDDWVYAKVDSALGLVQQALEEMRSGRGAAS